MSDLLKQYVRTGSSEAFACILRAHSDAVYSQCLRQLRDPSLAEEVTQQVFVLLACKAGRIPARVILAGWLFNATRHQCAGVRRTEFRRHKHEKQAMMIRAQNQNQVGNDLHVEAEPLLNHAIADLGGKDRDAILLKFFQGSSMSEVATVLGVSENAAKQRVWRAVEKLRQWFAARGLVMPSPMVVSLLGTAVKPTPPHVALKIGMVPLAKPGVGLWAWLGSKTAASVALGAVTLTAAMMGVKAFAQQGSPPVNPPVIMADVATPATQPGLGNQATPLDGLRKLTAALHSGDKSAIDACLTDDGKDPQAANLVRAQLHGVGAWCHVREVARAAFKGQDITLERFKLDAFPALGGNLEAMFDKMLEKNAAPPQVKIDGEMAQIRVNVAKELFDYPGQNPMRFQERWSGATLFFQRINGEWKLDTGRSINAGITNFACGNAHADAIKVAVQFMNTSADATMNEAAQIQSGQIASIEVVNADIEEALEEAFNDQKITAMNMISLPVVGGN